MIEGIQYTRKQTEVVSHNKNNDWECKIEHAWIIDNMQSQDIKISCRNIRSRDIYSISLTGKCERKLNPHGWYHI